MSDIKLINAFNGMNISSYGGTLCDTGNDDICEFDMIDQASDAAYAINNHNDLVKQVAELKKALVEVSEQAIDLFTYSEGDKDYFSVLQSYSLVNTEVETIRSMVKVALKESE